MEKVPFYSNSVETAKHEKEIELWRASHKANISCKQYIDSRETGLSATAYDGYHVDKGYSKKLVELFGYERTMCVLASTVRHLSYDGRLSPGIKEWASKQYFGLTKKYEDEYILNTHPGLVDILAKNVKELYDGLSLFTIAHCKEDSSQLDFSGKLLVLSSRALKEKYWLPENQLWFCNGGGFGCSPTSSGRAVYAKCLFDGEETRWNRSQFIGVIKDEYVPDWAKQKLEEMKSSENSQSEGMDMNL